ncbi:MAG: hypothetical protein K8I30_20885 [Anaerolineae bacterium]|nr:hypothetical protein [Anaerolineae bacterium]
MPYQVSWYVDQRVVYCRAFGSATIEDIHNLNHETQTYVRAGQPLVHVICDLKGIEKFPTNIAGMRQSLEQMDYERMGWVIVVGAGNALLRFVASLITQFIIPDVRLRMFDTLELAVSFLREHDATLPELPVTQQSA